jgi:citrate lyase beta subunit
MQATLTQDLLAPLSARLASARVAPRASRDDEGAQPVHVVYGGAHLFRPDIVARLQRVALEVFEAQTSTPEALAALFGLAPSIATRVHPRLRAKLATQPVEDLRVDFEDGYGHRPDAEEDAQAVEAATAMAASLKAGTLPPRCGIRVKSLSPETSARAIRTLDLFLTALARQTGGTLPAGFVVTLPKVTDPVEVAVLAELLTALEGRLGLPPGAVRIELMIEAPEALLTPDGRVALPSLVEAGAGRVRGCHFGTYDYTAACGVTAAFQTMDHPASAFALHLMQVALAGSGVWLSDGATTVMPVPPHRASPGTALTAAEEAANKAAVGRALRLAYDNARQSLIRGVPQGWDLHPGQLVARHAAVGAFFAEGLPAVTARLRNFLAAAAQATRVGDAFDDAATGQGLLNHFRRGLACGALDEADVRATGLAPDDLASRSFPELVRRAAASAL